MELSIQETKNNEDLFPPSTLNSQIVLEEDKVTIDRRELIYLLKLVIPDITFMAMDDAKYHKYCKLLKKLEN